MACPMRGRDSSKFPTATLAELYTRLCDEYGGSVSGLDPNSPLRASVAMAVLKAVYLGSADFKTLEFTARAFVRSSIVQRDLEIGGRKLESHRESA